MAPDSKRGWVHRSSSSPQEVCTRREETLLCSLQGGVSAGREGGLGNVSPGEMRGPTTRKEPRGDVGGGDTSSGGQGRGVTVREGGLCLVL